MIDDAVERGVKKEGVCFLVYTVNQSSKIYVVGQYLWSYLCIFSYFYNEYDEFIFFNLDLLFFSTGHSYVWRYRDTYIETCCTGYGGSSCRRMYIESIYPVYWRYGVKLLTISHSIYLKSITIHLFIY